MKLKGFVHYNCHTNTFDVSAWVERDGEIKVTDLGALNADLYDKDGNPLSYNVTGLAPNGLGLYNFQEIEPTFIENGKTYLLRIETTHLIDTLSTFLPFTITNI